MPKIDLKHESKLPPNEAMAKIKSFFESDKDLQKIDSNIKTDFKDQTGKVSGSQFTAQIQTKAKDSGSEIQVTVEIPLLLSMFKGKIQEMVDKKLKKYLA